MAVFIWLTTLNVLLATSLENGSGNKQEMKIMGKYANFKKIIFLHR
jgi:hypothetical protein